MIIAASALGTAWPGEQLAYRGESARASADIYLRDLSRAVTINLTNTFFTEEYAPAWSPDGQYLAFAANDDGDMDIYTLHIRSGQRLQRTDNINWDSQPAWSADGQHIAYATYSSAGQNLAVVAIGEGITTARLTALSGEETFPHWSPDGREITYVYHNDYLNDIETVIYALRFDTPAAPPRLIATRHPVGTVFATPRWSPDGTRLAYAAGEGGSDDVYVLDMTTQETLNLTNHPADDGEPAWSSGGDWIAFRSKRTGRYQVYVIRLDGSGLRQITHGAGDYASPAWRPR